MSFGTKLAEYRRRAGMTQEVLAERIGLARKHLSDIENEADPSPKIGTIVQIIKELDLTEDEARNLFVESLVEKGVPPYVFDAPSG